MEKKMRLFTIPKWTAHDVSNWDELIVKNSDGSTELNDATKILINLMPMIGICQINTSNTYDAWIRISLIQSTYGPMFVDKNNTPVFLTPSDVERHIGLDTEGKTLTLDEFCSSKLPNKIKCSEHELSSFIANGNRTLLKLAMENELYI